MLASVYYELLNIEHVYNEKKTIYPLYLNDLTWVIKFHIWSTKPGMGNALTLTSIFILI